MTYCIFIHAPYLTFIFVRYKMYVSDGENVEIPTFSEETKEKR